MRRVLNVLLIILLICCLGFAFGKRVEEEDAVEALEYHTQQIHSILSKMSENTGEMDDEQILFFENIGKMLKDIGDQAAGAFNKGFETISKAFKIDQQPRGKNPM